MGTPITHAVAGAPIERVAISPDNHWLAAYYPNENWHLVLRALNDPARTNIPVSIQSRGPDFRFLPDRALLLVADSNYLKVCAPTDPTPTVTPLIPEPIYPIGSFAVTSDGRAVIVGRSKPYVSAGYAAFARWDITPNAPVARRWQKRIPVGRDLPTRGLGLLPREKAFVAVERRHDTPNNRWVEEIAVFDADSGTRLFVLPVSVSTTRTDHEIHAIAVSPRVPLVAGIVSGCLFVWSAKPKSEAPTRISRLDQFRDVAFHPDGQTLFAVTREGVFRYGTQNWTELRLDVPITGHPTCLAVSPDGNLLAVGMVEGAVTVCAY